MWVGFVWSVGDFMVCMGDIGCGVGDFMRSVGDNGCGGGDLDCGVYLSDKFKRKGFCGAETFVCVFYLFSSSDAEMPGLVISFGFRILSRSSSDRTFFSRQMSRTGLPVVNASRAISVALSYPMCGLMAVMMPIAVLT